MSAFCNLCHRDADTGEYFCARLGGWVEKCPSFPDGYPWDAERGNKAGEERRMKLIDIIAEWFYGLFGSCGR